MTEQATFPPGWSIAHVSYHEEHNGMPRCEVDACDSASGSVRVVMPSPKDAMAMAAALAWMIHRENEASDDAMRAAAEQAANDALIEF